MIWRRDRIPTITVHATNRDDTQWATVDTDLKPTLKAFVDTLPAGVKLETGGTVDSSSTSQKAIFETVPLMLLLIVFLLMVQLQSVTKMLLVLSTAPLGLIGVVTALLSTGKPLGFVAFLGVLALGGIIIRNSVILIGQIDDNLRDGMTHWESVVQATEHRMRPILLTAAAASLGMVPIANEVFSGPMAYAMIGGIFSATILTLFFLPALYIAVYRVKRNEDDHPLNPPDREHCSDPAVLMTASSPFVRRAAFAP